jgi:O-antigen/teichoic acid export membrane protein
MGPLNQSSLKRRSFFKLITNLSGSIAGMMIQLMVPRALGPSDYGNFSFLTNFFRQFFGFLNLNSSTAFYIRLSQRPNDKGLVRFYFSLIGIMTTGLFLFVVIAIIGGIYPHLWPAQKITFVLFGALWALLFFLLTVSSEMSDAYGLTIYSETIKAIAKFMGLGVVFLMFKYHFLSLGSYFAVQSLFFILPAIVLFIHIIKTHGPFFRGTDGRMKPDLDYADEFIKFCLPLFPLVLVGGIDQIFERWLLQVYSGSQTQGYFALSGQVGNICLIFTSSVIPLIFRENAVSFKNNDVEKIRWMFKRYFSIIFALSSFVCTFCAVHAKSLVYIVGGDKYANAIIPTVVMCFFPIHQTLGQLSAGLFLSTERVKAYRNIGLLFSSVGIITSLFVLGPSKYGALELGAIGLSLKVLILQLVSVNVQIVVHCHYLHVPYKEMVVRQAVTISIFLGSAILSLWGASLFFPWGGKFGTFIVSGVFYSFLILGVGVYQPTLLGLNPSDLIRWWNSALNKMSFQTVSRG